MVHCRECGSQIGDAANFCEHCGAKVGIGNDSGVDERGRLDVGLYRSTSLLVSQQRIRRLLSSLVLGMVFIMMALFYSGSEDSPFQPIALVLGIGLIAAGIVGYAWTKRDQERY